MSILPRVSLSVYHATKTGEKLEVLKSFKKMGALPGLALGYGQGAGFYVFTRLDKANQHAKEFLKDVPGLPLIIVINADINPKDWDLDYELSCNFAKRFLWENFDTLFKKLSDDEIYVDGKFVTVSKSRKHPEGFVIVRGNSSRAFGIKSAECTIRDGEILGPIFNKLQEKFPREVHAFEGDLFMRLANKRGLVIKYVGKKPLPVYTYFVYYRGKWISAKQFESIPEINMLIKQAA
ncbi:MAG: hypothetical protein QXM31_02140 [Candidatus Woesearchaeota archaeon]